VLSLSNWKKPHRDPHTGETKMVPLTGREKKFVLAYLKTLNGVKAAYEAGATTPERARSLSSLYLGKPHIREIIDQELANQVLSGPSILHRLSEQATANIADFFKEVLEIQPDGTVQVVGREVNWDLVKEKGYLIKKVGWDKGKFTFELYDAQKALEILGKHLKLWGETIDLQDLGDVIVKVVQGVRYEDL